MNEQFPQWTEQSQNNEQWSPSGQAIPITGRVIAMVDFKGRIFVATEYSVYELVDDELVRLKFREKVDPK